MPAPAPALVLSSLFPTTSLNPKLNRKLHIHHENQKKSRLLQLPPEIRNLIWHHLLSSIPIHLTWSYSKGLRRCPHCAYNPSALIQDKVCAYSGLRGTYIPPESDSDRTLKRGKVPPSSLNILRTTRQIRAEVSSLIISSCTLHIDSPYAFYAFFKYLNREQISRLSSLNLMCNAADIDYSPWNNSRLCWNRVLHPSVLSQLTGLKSLGIVIASQAEGSDIFDAYDSMHFNKSRGFLRFRQLHIPDVKVTVRSRMSYEDNTLWMPSYFGPHEFWNGENFKENFKSAIELKEKILGRWDLTPGDLKEAEKYAVKREGKKKAKKREKKPKRHVHTWRP